MLGGHLDSWHSATGATDNAVGCAGDDGGRPNPEGHRRQTAPHDPRRPVERRRAGPARFAGLRQGHFGIVRGTEARIFKLLPRISTRRGTGRVRGDRLRSAGVGRGIAASRFSRRSPTSASRRDGHEERALGARQTAFNAAGLPGVDFQLTRLVLPHLAHEPRYLRARHRGGHEEIVRDHRARPSYHLAMRDEPLPRFTQEKMPAPSPAVRPRRPRRPHRLPPRRQRQRRHRRVDSVVRALS